MTIDRITRARRPDVGKPAKTDWHDPDYAECFRETLAALMAAAGGGSLLGVFIGWLIWGVAW
jgi:hypothetical protein